MRTKFVPGTTASLSVTATTGAMEIPAPAGGLASTLRRQVRLYNEGANPCFVVFGVTGVTAVAGAGVGIAPGQAEIFTVLPGQTHLAAICRATLTTTLVVTGGEGD